MSIGKQKERKLMITKHGTEEGELHPFLYLVRCILCSQPPIRISSALSFFIPWVTPSAKAFTLLLPSSATWLFFQFTFNSFSIWFFFSIQFTFTFISHSTHFFHRNSYCTKATKKHPMKIHLRREVFNSWTIYRLGRLKGKK